MKKDKWSLTKAEHRQWLKKLKLWDPVFLFACSYHDIYEDEAALIGQVVEMGKKTFKVKWFSTFHDKECVDEFDLKDGTCSTDGDKRPFGVTKYTKERHDQVRKNWKRRAVTSFDEWLELDEYEIDGIFNILKSWQQRVKNMSEEGAKKYYRKAHRAKQIAYIAEGKVI